MEKAKCCEKMQEKALRTVFSVVPFRLAIQKT